MVILGWSQRGDGIAVARLGSAVEVQTGAGETAVNDVGPVLQRLELALDGLGDLPSWIRARTNRSRKSRQPNPFG